MEIFRMREEERTRVRQQLVQQMPPQAVVGQMPFAGNFANPVGFFHVFFQPFLHVCMCGKIQPPFAPQFGQNVAEVRMGMEGQQMLQRGGEPAQPPCTRILGFSLCFFEKNMSVFR